MKQIFTFNNTNNSLPLHVSHMEHILTEDQCCYLALFVHAFPVFEIHLSVLKVVPPC